MISFSMTLRRSLVAGGFLFGLASAQAQLLIGQTSGFTGPAASGVKENTIGAKLYFDAVNAGGGVNGQQIELISLDDKFEPALAVENAKQLITGKNVIALFLNRGTAHTEALLPLLNEYKVALVAPSSGAMLLHKPVKPYVFNVRASYQREAERAVRHMKQIGMTRIAVLHVDDNFGLDGLAGAMTGFAAAGVSPVVDAKFDRNTPDFSAVAPEIAKRDAQAVLVIGSTQAVAAATRAIRTAGSKAQIVTLSNNASDGFVKQMGEYARGTIVTQVFPYERSVSALIVKEAQKLAKAKGMEGVSPAMMEGFAGAKVLVEALRRAGPKPTRAGLISALNGIRKYDLGGMEISYSPDDHSGLDFADLSIIDEGGKLRR